MSRQLWRGAPPILRSKARFLQSCGSRMGLPSISDCPPVVRAHRSLGREPPKDLEGALQEPLPWASAPSPLPGTYMTWNELFSFKKKEKERKKERERREKKVNQTPKICPAVARPPSTHLIFSGWIFAVLVLSTYLSRNECPWGRGRGLSPSSPQSPECTPTSSPFMGTPSPPTL